MNNADISDIKRLKQLYIDKNIILKASFPQIWQTEFYRFIFPVGSFERQGHPEDTKPNGLALDIHGKGKAYHRIITDELSELEEATVRSKFLIMSPIGYFGLRRSGANARYLYAYTIDLDRVEIPNLRDLLYQTDNEILPRATFIVNSGTGLHLYYVFDDPIPLYPNVQEQLKLMKYALIRRIWNRYTSSDANVQQQGIFQGFRVVGSNSKLGRDYPVCAFLSGQRVSLDYLNSFVPDEVKIHDLYYKSSLSLEEAKTKYPEWYDKHIILGKSSGRWNVKRDVYDWWKRRLTAEITVGHRFYGIFALAVYAKKCNIPEEELRADAFRLIPHLDSLTNNPKNHFTEDDVISALEAYNENFITFPRDDIGSLAGVSMPMNKRNGRAQLQHIQIMSAIRDIVHPNGEWRNSSGRPSAQQAVERYVQSNPSAPIAEIMDVLGVSKSTAYKYRPHAGKSEALIKKDNAQTK